MRKWVWITRQKKQPLTKGEMAEMLAGMESRLETSIKGEIAILRQDMKHAKKDGGSGERLDNHGSEEKGLKENMDEMCREQRYMMYKIEDQENKNIRKKY